MALIASMFKLIMRRNSRDNKKHLYPAIKKSRCFWRITHFPISQVSLKQKLFVVIIASAKKVISANHLLISNKK